jgi:uncharacterized protein (DUF1800 family)
MSVLTFIDLFVHPKGIFLMNRRDFFTGPSRTRVEGETRYSGNTESVAAGDAGRRKALSAAGLQPYTGPWGFTQAAHLLRRTMFGLKKSDVDTLLGMSMNQAVDMVLTPSATPPPVPGYNDGTPTWVNDAFNSSKDGLYQTYLLSWWVGLMLKQEISITEKMTLFWHNHFATGLVSVKDARYMYKQNQLLRKYALGNFKELTREITIDPAMLRYLNGSTNTKAAPNENYGRELQELFTIGKGPERAPGDYTNYTEADIKAAARVLTGWGDDTTAISNKFTSGNHDTGDKLFSAAYGNRTIKGGTGVTNASRELDELLDMIFSQQAVALRICRKIYRWFVDYVIDPTTETNVIVPLADILRTNNYDIKPVMEALLKSEHFYDAAILGCMIKTPCDIVMGTQRTFTVADVQPPELQKQNWAWRTLRRTAATMGMDLMNPPNVAGWAAYWQEPVYHELWINADTLQKRVKYTNDLTFDGFQLDEAYGKSYIDPFEITGWVSDPSDPNKLIAEVSRILYPIDLDATQLAAFKSILIPGLPDYEWTSEWNSYKSQPGDPTAQKAVEDRLRALLKFMLAMAEYQLS